MKVGPVEISRRRAFVAAPSPPQGELGSDGDSWLSRYMGGGPDPNVVLSGSQKFDVYDEMALADVHCKAVLQMVELPIVGAIWDFDPASDQPVDELVAEACRWQFGLAGYEGQLDVSWKRSLGQLFLKNRYGCMFEELVWGPLTTFQPKGDAGAARMIRPLARLAPRMPRTISEVDYQDGVVSLVKQNLPGAQPIPGSKIAHYMLDPRPGRWDGTSILRAAWGPWELKKQLMISAGIAWDRWASGFPVIRYPQNGGGGEQAKAEEMGRSVRNHERAYLAFAGPPPTDLAPNGWDIKIEGGPSNLPDPVPLIKEYSLEILWSALLQWMGIATSSHTGARATAQVQDEPYYMAIEAHAEEAALERQHQVVRRFVDVNFGTEVAAPKLTVSKIQSEDVMQLAQTLSNLKLAGLDFSDVETQNDIRERLHLPDLPDGFAPVATEGDGLPLPPRSPKPAKLPPGQTTLPVDG